MQWYTKLIDDMKKEITYSNKELIDKLKDIKPNMSNSTYHWAVNGLVREGVLEKQGYDSYSLSTKKMKEEYFPAYSKEAKKLTKILNKEYPFLGYTVFETTLLNEFVNHLIAKNTIYLQVEKESGAFVFRYLQENVCKNIMYKPSVDEYNLYWMEGSVIVTDLISEAPVRNEDKCSIMLEKMLVDIVSDKIIAQSYSSAEISHIFSTAEKRYKIDKVRMLRYARRRNRQEAIKGYLEGKR